MTDACGYYQPNFSSQRSLLCLFFSMSFKELHFLSVGKMILILKAVATCGLKDLLENNRACVVTNMFAQKILFL